MESNLPVRKTERLLYGRISIPGATYFLTICAADCNRILTKNSIAAGLNKQFEIQENEGDLKLISGTLMPDHLHLIIRLSRVLTISQVVAKFKTKTRDMVPWQRNFYEHRIRPDENEESYGFYVFMNPYTAELIDLNQLWPWWKRWRTTPYDFESALEEQVSIPSNWINKSKSDRAKIQVDRNHHDGD